jgi:hypothetical protein
VDIRHHRGYGAHRTDRPADARDAAEFDTADLEVLPLKSQHIDSDGGTEAQVR